MMGSTKPTSPRLPSPPPPVEDLSNPTSPTFAPSPAKQIAPSPSQTRRIRKGTKAKDIGGPPLVPLADLDSAFQLQEHLAAVLAATTHPTSSDHSVPLTRADAERIATPPEGVDEWLWCYELTRRLTRDLNALIVGLLSDNCTNETCPEMRASSWQYLCAVHETPRACCAMDYSTHTLDHAATTLTSTKHFPSRLSLNTNGMKLLSSIFRRLYRIFAHAWFLHQNVFWDVENEFGLYVFFKTVSEKFGLIPEDNLTIPSTAKGGYDGSAPGEKSRGGGKKGGNEGNGSGSGYRGMDREMDEIDDDDDDEDEVDNDDFDAQGQRNILPRSSSLGIVSSSNSSGGGVDDADGEPVPVTAIPDHVLGIKQDFPLFSYNDSAEAAGSLTEEEKEEMRARRPMQLFPPAIEDDCDEQSSNKEETKNDSTESPADGEDIEMKLDLGDAGDDSTTEEKAEKYET